MVHRKDLEKLGKEMLPRDNIAHNWIVDEARGSEKSFPCILGHKGETGGRIILSDLQD